jgi:hypothetical protein
MAIVINGSGTVTGISVGGLPDGIVDTDTLANTTVTAAKVAADVATQAELDAAGFDTDAAQVFNESGADVDFRVEGSGEANAFFVQGSDGNVGINTAGTNIAADLQVGHGPGSKHGQILISADNGLHQYLRLTNGGGAGYNNYPAGIWYSPSGNMELRASSGASTSNAAQIVLANTGFVGIGVTSPAAPLSVYRSNSNKIIETKSYSTDAQKHLIFINNSGSNVGWIDCSTSATTFSTSSDYRLKENVDYDFDATTRLKQLKPARFNFISDDTNTLVDGFIAHEVSSVVPEAISGEKDAMTTEVLYVEGDELPEGKSIGDVKEASVIEPQGIDQAKLVPLLVKTIQELEARITALEA